MHLLFLVIAEYQLRFLDLERQLWDETFRLSYASLVLNGRFTKAASSIRHVLWQWRQTFGTKLQAQTTQYLSGVDGMVQCQFLPFQLGYKHRRVLYFMLQHVKLVFHRRTLMVQTTNLCLLSVGLCSFLLFDFLALPLLGDIFGYFAYLLVLVFNQLADMLHRPHLRL